MEISTQNCLKAFSKYAHNDIYDKVQLFQKANNPEAKTKILFEMSEATSKYHIKPLIHLLEKYELLVSSLPKELAAKAHLTIDDEPRVVDFIFESLEKLFVSLDILIKACPKLKATKTPLKDLRQKLRELCTKVCTELNKNPHFDFNSVLHLWIKEGARFNELRRAFSGEFKSILKSMRTN